MRPTNIHPATLVGYRLGRVAVLLAATLLAWQTTRATDGDGFSDSLEVQKRSNPSLASSIPGVMANIRKAMEIEFQTARGTSYAVQRQMPDGNWTNLGPVMLGDGTPMKQLFSAEQIPDGIWRVVVESKPNIEELLDIPPGTFVMGSPTSEKERSSTESQHTVVLTKGFWMAQREVTQGEYLAVMGSNPSYFRNGIDADPSGTGGKVVNDLRRPVEQVSWSDATNYCAKLSQRDRAAGRIPSDFAYRLPTEAEWEYACRGWTTNAFHFGNSIRPGMANFYAVQEYNSAVGSQSNPNNPWLGQTAEPGSYSPNAFGLYDMHGNVWEWCSDWYGNYPSGVVTDPVGPASGSNRVVRGGSWISNGWVCRAAYHYNLYPDGRNRYLGFRVVLAPGR